MLAPMAANSGVGTEFQAPESAGERLDSNRQSSGAFSIRTAERSEQIGSQREDCERVSRYTLLGVAFLLNGCSSVLPWSNTLNLIPFISARFLNDWDMGNLLLGIFQVGNLSAQVTMIWRGATNKWWLYLGIFLSCILFAFLGPSVSNGSVNTRVGLLYFFSLVFGIGSGMLQGAGYSMASVMPKSQVGNYSLGQGVAGILSIAFVALLALISLDMNVQRDVLLMIYLTSGLTVAVGTAGAICTEIAMRSHEVKASVAGAQPQLKKKAVDPNAASEPTTVEVVTAVEGVSGENIEQRRTLAVLCSASVPLGCVFVNFFLTMNMYPRVGPLHWNITDPPKNTLIWFFLVFPCMDMAGKALCAVGDDSKAGLCSKFLKVPYVALPWATLARALLYIPFFLAKSLEDVAVVNAFWFLLIVLGLLGLTHGWLATASIMNSFELIRDPREKDVIGPANVICLILGIMAGLYLALLY